MRTKTLLESEENIYRDGDLLTARITQSAAICVDKCEGTVYIGETASHTVRKITPDGKVTTLAGNPNIFGHSNGMGNEATFQNIWAITTDGRGNIIVADTDNHTIRKIDPNGEVSTLAGTFSGGFQDGPAESSLFRQPRGILCLSDRIYISDSENHCLRMIYEGHVTKICGIPETEGCQDGDFEKASFRCPLGMVWNRDGNLFVVDLRNHLIRSVDLVTKEVTTLLGKPGRGYHGNPLHEAQVDYPYGIDIDLYGNIIFADSDNHIIRSISPGGSIEDVAGQPRVQGYRDGEMAEFFDPRGLAVDCTGIYVADYGNICIRKIHRPLDWKPSVHWGFSKKFREMAKCVAMMRRKECLFAVLPRELIHTVVAMAIRGTMDLDFDAIPERVENSHQLTGVQ